MTNQPQPTPVRVGVRGSFQLAAQQGQVRVPQFR